MNARAISIAALGGVLVVGTFIATHRPTPSIRVGGLYSLRYQYAYRVAKVLAVDEAVHLLIYKQEFRERPARVEESKLSVGTPYDRDGIGWAHVPMSRDSFAGMKPHYLQSSTITKSELEEYELWRKEGGVWF